LTTISLYYFIIDIITVDLTLKKRPLIISECFSKTQNWHGVNVRDKNSNIMISSGFTAILLLLVILISISIYIIIENNKNISEITANQKDSEDIFNMRDAAHQRALYLYRMMSLEDPFERDDVFLLFNDEATNFIIAIDRLRSGTKNSIILKDVEKIGILANKGGYVQNKAVDLILEDEINAAHDLILSNVIPVQDNVMKGLTELYAKQQIRLNNEIDRIHIKNDTAYLMITLVGSSAILLGFIIALFVYAHNKKTLINLQQQRQIAEHANKSKSDFLANISHEIRTPLSAIIGFSESILDSGSDIKIQRKNVHAIARNGKHLLQLINDILDFSKIEAGQLQVESIDTHPLSVLQEVENIVTTLALDKGLDFNINVQYPIPGTFKSDPVRLRQILINLCSNAIKFTEQGSVSVNVTYDSQENLLRFTVIDTGIGLTKLALEKIFSPFSQADTSTTRKFGGTGLGLTISRQLADKMHGKLKCTSKQGQGSQFYLELKIQTDSSDSLIYKPGPAYNHITTSYNADNIPRLNSHILLAEDSPDNQDLIRIYVNRTGAKLTIVENGSQAVDKALSGNFDLILMDMQMPVMDGITAITSLRASGYTKPIVIVSANALQSDREHACLVGADDYVVKPINLDHFYEVLARYSATSETGSAPDSDYAEHSTADINDSMKELILKFVHSLPELKDDINSAYKTLNWEILASVSHRLKGLGGSFGFPQLTAICKEINIRSRHQESTGLKKFISELNTEINRIVRQHIP